MRSKQYRKTIKAAKAIKKAPTKELKRLAVHRWAVCALKMLGS